MDFRSQATRPPERSGEWHAAHRRPKAADNGRNGWPATATNRRPTSTVSVLLVVFLLVSLIFSSFYVAFSYVVGARTTDCFPVSFFLFPPYRVSRGSAFSCSLALLSEKNAEGPFRFHR